MSLDEFSQEMLPAIEAELKKRISHPLALNSGLIEMCTYHLGWTGEDASPKATGKRIRPLITTLAAEATGGDWKAALPAAAAVELVHNFSLIHDDIQDQSETRRGRKTVWVKWGAAHGINAGDLMITLAFATIPGLKDFCSSDQVLTAQSILLDACVGLTKGQYLDMAYERAENIKMEQYWEMIQGKTAALLSAAAQIGALVGGADPATQTGYYQFGQSLGLAFQVWDDWLGIWGDPVMTGKSASSDLVTGKKTYPILYGLQLKGEFANRWSKGPVHIEDVNAMADLLRKEGAEESTLHKADELNAEAKSALNAISSNQPAFMALVELTDLLLNRKR
jgi:geranylgeranyl diphosphate synthase, type I